MLKEAKSVSEIVRGIIMTNLEPDVTYEKKELTQLARAKYEGEKSEVTEGIVTGAVRELCKSGVLANVGYGQYAKGAGNTDMSLAERIETAIRNFKTELSNAIRATDTLNCTNDEFKTLVSLREIMPGLEEYLNKVFKFDEPQSTKKKPEHPTKDKEPSTKDKEPSTK